MCQEKLEKELTRLIIKAVKLEDCKPEDIAPEAPLFADGLGLDSIDALEIAIAISEKYGVELHADNQEHLMQVFATVRSLSDFVKEHIAK